MRWTSSGTVATRLMLFTTGGPIVRFGTKWPSMTSTCRRSAPPCFGGRDLFRQPREVGGQQRRGNLQGHLPQEATEDRRLITPNCQFPNPKTTSSEQLGERRTTSPNGRISPNCIERLSLGVGSCPPPLVAIDTCDKLWRGLAKSLGEGGEVGSCHSSYHSYRLTSREIGSPGAIWKPPCGFWRSTIPAGTPGYGCSPTTATRKPRTRSRSAARSPFTPMSIGHHVAGAARTPVHKQRNLRARTLRLRGLRHDRPDRILRRSDFGHAAQFESILLYAHLRRPLRFAKQRRHRQRPRPRADPDLHAALPSCTRACLRLLCQDLPGRNFRVDATAFLDLQGLTGVGEDRRSLR